MKISNGVRWIAATRPGFLVVTLIAALLGIASAQACGAGWHPLDAAATVVLALLAHAAINLHNDWGDALIGSDALNTDRIGPFTGGSRVVQDGVFTAAQLRDMVQMIGMVVIGGGVVVGADYVQRRHFDLAPALAGVSPALLIAAMLWIAEFPDARSDAQVGKRTLVVRLGPTAAAVGYLLLVLAAHAWVAFWWAALWLPTTAWWALGSAPLSLAAAGLLWRHRQAPARLRSAIVLTLVAAVLHGGLLTAAFLHIAGLR
jgi:1,4-dihydroxy-2-naphthoate polyprenyltransferase